MKINISNINFKARCSNEVIAQFKKGERFYRNNDEKLQEYQSTIDQIKSINSETTVDTYTSINCATGRAYSPAIILDKKQSSGIKFATIKTPESVYRRAIKLTQLSTLEGVKALYESIKGIY